jgi:hypothetical protein
VHLNEESRQSHNDPGADIMALAHSKLPKKTWLKPSKAKSVASEEQSPHNSHCYNCGGHGHLAHNCPLPKQEGEKANFTIKNDDSSSQFSYASY